MLTKEYIKEIKLANTEGLKQLIHKNMNNSGNLVFILENLGKLPVSFNYHWLVDLINYDNEQVRFWVVKNLGKLKSENIINHLENISKNDKSTLVRREAISSIGRLRDEKNQQVLLGNLLDEDPKIVSQAIRGLLVFKGDKKIDIALKELINHENEMVRSVIYKEYFAQ
ncbi:MAG: HEAT repeat domain-containing protein, partial [Bacteroidota bacterium]|nr:HEAT repeat domain-containing protein [Bacteroidota bacterium]